VSSSTDGSSKIEEEALSWSPWLDFDKPTIVTIPDTKGGLQDAYKYEDIVYRKR
jgi:hypothetical protein